MRSGRFQSGLCPAWAGVQYHRRNGRRKVRSLESTTRGGACRIFPWLDIFELIGRGGMGRHGGIRARQKELDRQVVLPPEIGQQESFARRFTREAQAMAELSHPNIVTIHDFGQRGGPKARSPNGQPRCSSCSAVCNCEEGSDVDRRH